MSYTQSSWRTSHDSKKIESYYPDSDSSSMYTGNQTTFDDERFVNNNQTDSRKLQTIQRKISKQKIVAEHRTEQSNGDHMFESPHRRTLYSTSNEFDTPLRHPTGSRMLHEDNEIILSNDFNHQAFQQPNTRKVTKIISKENYSLSNSRPTQPRSASASSGLTKKHEPKRSTLTSNDIQRLKHVRRHEPAHVPSGPASKKSLITPDSWKSYPVVIKNAPAKKRATATVNQPTKTEEESKPIVEQSSIPKKPRTEKPKRDTSASKPTTTEQTPATKPPKPEKTKEEKDKIQKYILEKRQEHEKNTSDEKQLKIVQEKERKNKLKKLNEQIKKVAQQPLPPSLIKKSASSQLPSHDHSEQTRERLLHLLGPRITSELPTEYHRNIHFEQPAVHERSSSSSSSSSSESIVEIQPPKIDRTITREHSEPPIQTGIEQRHQNILRWAMNIAQDCDNIETKFKYFRPDGTQPFDLIPASQQNPQHDDGNLRSQIPIVITNEKKTDPKPIIPSKILRPSGRLSHLNQNRTSEYQGQQLPGVGNLRDPELERRVKRDRAAAKIQAVYRGYTVRKSIHWFNEKQQRLDSEYNKRPVHKPTKISSHRTDIFDAPSMNLDMRFSDDNFTIGSTLLRHYQRNGTAIIPSTTRPISIQPQSKPQQQKIQRPSTPDTYSDDYENITSTGSSTPINKKPIPEKPRVIQQPVPNTESTSSQSSSYSTTSPASSSTPTPTPKSHVPSTIQRRRSISPPLPPQMSPDNGRSIQYHPPPPPATTTSRRIFDERRYSPDALERQLNAELHLLDGVEASMTQVENMERLRSVALAQQEVVSLAQVLKNKPSTDGSPQQQIRKSTTRPLSSSSSSSSSNRKRRSPSPHSRHRTIQSTSSSSESILTAREKRLRQKFHSETEFQAYEKRLKDVEKKIRLLVKRDEDIDDQKLNATEIFDDKRNVASPRVPPKSSNESSISEDLLVSNKSSSSSSALQRKPTNDTSEIRTETIQKDSDSTSTSIHQHQSDAITIDGSDIERRIRDYREQLKTKKSELDKLKQRKNKDELKRQEDELKKQLETYNQQIETLRLQPAAPKVSAPSRKSPLKKSSSSSSSGSSTPTKPQESSIAEDLPASSTTSQSKNNVIEKQVEEKHPIVKKERDFFDDDDDEEEEKKKGPELKPLETPRDERDTQQDAQSISIATDIAASSETDNDDSRRPSIDNEKPILNLAQNFPLPLKSKEDSESSSSTTTSERLPKQQIQSQSLERKSSPIANDYDEDFSEVSHSPSTPTKEPPPKSNVNEIDVESIQEDIEEKQSLHDTNQSLSSKSSADEQSEILVLVKKSANNTPRRQDDKTPEEEFPPPPPPVFTPEPKIELNNNDDTSHDVSEEEEEEEEEEDVHEEDVHEQDVHEQENKVDKLTDLFLRTFIDEAIDQGKEIERLKKETDQKKNVLTHEAKEWVSEEDSTDEDDIPKQPGPEPNELEIDLSGVGEKNADERRIESPRKSVIEEPVKPLVPHTREQVIQLTDQAIQILFHQNTDFSNRSTIKCKIPNSYFTYDQQDSDNEDIRQNRRAYCQMIFDLCVELLHEMDSENIQSPQYPDWQKARLISKRYYRAKKPANRHEKEQFIQTKILEILNLNSRQTTYSKYRVSNSQRNGIEKFEIVLDEEIRRTESQWINYDEDSIQIKFNIADLILDQLIQETVTECLHVVDKRLFLSSNSTRL